MLLENHGKKVKYNFIINVILFFIKIIQKILKNRCYKYGLKIELIIESNMNFLILLTLI